MKITDFMTKTSTAQSEERPPDQSEERPTTQPEERPKTQSKPEYFYIFLSLSVFFNKFLPPLENFLAPPLKKGTHY